MLEIKYYHVKVLLKTFQLNGHNKGFYQRTQEPPFSISITKKKIELKSEAFQ